MKTCRFSFPPFLSPNSNQHHSNPLCRLRKRLHGAMRRALTPLSCMFVTMSKWQLPQPRSIRPERPVAITSARGNLETWAEVVSVAVTFESCLNFALDSFQNSYSFQGILEGDRSCIRLFHYSRHQPHCPVPVHFIHSPQGEQYLQEQEATLQDRLIRVGPLRAALAQAT